MAVTISVSRADATDKGIIIEGTLALSGNYPAGGDTVDFSSVPDIPSNVGPLGLVEVAEQPASGSTPQGYLFLMIAGSTMKNWLLSVNTDVGQPPTELTAAAYPAAAKASTIQFRAFFNFAV